jgi:hypothetical protein
MVLKTENQNVFDTTYTDDTELVYHVDMDRRYGFKLSVPFRVLGSTSGYKFRLTVPGEGSGSEILAVCQVYNGVTGTLQNVKVDQNPPFAITGPLTNIGLHYAYVSGMIQIGNGFTGDLQFQFAQNVLDGVNEIRVLTRATLDMESLG